MSDLLETLETIRAEEADVRRLFDRADGTRVRGNGRTATPQYMAQLSEAVELIADVLEGRRPVHYLTEVMTTSDFPLLFGDVLDRQLLARYRETDPTYRSYCRVSTVRDFRPSKRFAVDGAEGVLSDVAERQPYPEQALAEAKDEIQVVKFGRRLGFSWEQMVNDDLDAFASAPDRLARAARRTEQKRATQLFVDANGPHASLYTVPFGNIVTGNPPLSITALQTALTHFATLTDEDGEPIGLGPVTLVVPPALEVVAQNILNAIEIRDAAGSGASGDNLNAVNWMRGRVTLQVEPYIPIVASGANGATSWWLFASPQESRPALEVAFLRGFAEPGLFMKSPNASRVGGGAVDPMVGDFDTDSIDYKVRHVFGTARLTNTGGWRATVASNGSGTGGS